jgi:hypothetical protein
MERNRMNWIAPVHLVVFDFEETHRATPAIWKIGIWLETNNGLETLQEWNTQLFGGFFLIMDS